MSLVFLDMSSSSVNSEKVDYDTYIINSNYEKINSSSATNEKETTFIKQCSQSFVLSSPSIDNDDQGELLSLEAIESEG